jgi:hypothetical protein
MATDVNPVALGLTQKNPQTRSLIQSITNPSGEMNQTPFPQERNQTPFPQPSNVMGGETAPMPTQNQGIQETPKQGGAGSEFAVDKNKLPPAVKKELENYDLPYAKAAAWNAFFSNLAKGAPEAIAAYGNTYGKTLGAFQEQEAQYNAERMRINQGAKDAKRDTLANFTTGDENLDQIARSLGSDPVKLRAYAEKEMATRPEMAQKLVKLANQLDIIESDRRDNLLQATQVGGKVKATKEINGYDKDGNTVTQIVTTYENGKNKVTYITPDGRQTSKPPPGFETETGRKAREDRLSREQIAADANTTRQLIAEIARSNRPLSASDQKVVDRFNSLDGSLRNIGIIQDDLKNKKLNLGGGFFGKAEQATGSFFGTTEAQDTSFVLDQINKTVLPQVKLLGANPSNADREYVTRHVPDAGWSPEKINEWLQRAKGAIEFEQANMYRTGTPILKERLGTPPAPTATPTNPGKVVDFKDLPPGRK